MAELPQARVDRKGAVGKAGAPLGTARVWLDGVDISNRAAWDERWFKVKAGEVLTFRVFRLNAEGAVYVNEGGTDAAADDVTALVVEVRE